MKYTLGIDTSCYTTSVAIMDKAGNLLADERRILKVAAGGRGLAQSEMVFQHTRNLPVLFEQAVNKIEKPVRFQAIGVSAYPRPLPDSYMPAFLVGDGYAKVLAAAQGSKLFRISHQEGHVFAGIWSAGGPNSKEFLAVHVSGGTTEIVRVLRQEQNTIIDLLGGTQDLHAGQFVDRVGVALKLPFPAGKHLEKLALTGRDEAIKIPVSAKGMQVSFSGPATHALRMVEKGIAPAAVAAGVEFCIGATLSKMIKAAVEETGLQEVLMVGGVMSNQFIRQFITSKLSMIDKTKLYFPKNEYSPDNAVGTAYFTLLNSTNDITPAYDT